jgi:hypothetical protein
MKMWLIQLVVWLVILTLFCALGQVFDVLDMDDGWSMVYVAVWAFLLANMASYGAAVANK